jgi:hypothetical protein
MLTDIEQIAVPIRTVSGFSIIGKSRLYHQSINAAIPTMHQKIPLQTALQRSI